MAIAVIRRWGNSLALRIPREIAAMLDLDEMLRNCKPAHFRRSAEDRAWLDERPAGRELL